MTDNDRMLIHIPKDGEYIEILGHRIDGFDSFQAFCEYLKKFAEMEETINRQKAEISVKRKLLKKAGEMLMDEASSQSLLWKKHYESFFESAKEAIKAEAIKEFAERLKAKAYTNNYWHEVVLVSEIDNLVKEFTEEQQ